HYFMGGIRVDADSQETSVPGLFATGECAAGLHGANRLGGNSLSDLLVFGRRAGMGAADYVRALSDRPKVSEAAVDDAAKLALAPFEGPSNGDASENPYTLQLDLQDSMNTLVGIIRKADEVCEAIEKLKELRERYKRVRVEGDRHFNPGWHLAIDLRNMLIVSECIAMAALERTESRGGHTRDDHPSMDSMWRKTLLVCRASQTGGADAVVPDVSITREDQIPMREDLLELIEVEELEKYFTSEELANHSARRA
ncbi:MAG: FAD-binding protein, partial [Mycobacterium sp.]